MKIWYQSGLSLHSPHFTTYAANLKSYLNQLARPGTEVSVNGVEISTPNLDRYLTEELLHSGQILKNLVKAQKEGFDAFCVGNIYDPAFYALRQVAEIPVCSLAETSMLLACQLAPNFSILCHDDPLMNRIVELVKRYGLKDRFIQCDTFHIYVTEIVKALDDPEIFLKPARRIAREAKAKGVCMFINGEGIFNPIVAKHKIREIEGIPVLEGGGALIKMTEMLVDMKQLGIGDRSKLGLYMPVPEDDLKTILKIYGISG